MIELFSTCPPSKDLDAQAFVRRVGEVSRWTERAGYRGVLVYTDNSLVDPWLVAQIVLDVTTSLCPLVAVQPAYMHPYAVAKIVASIAHLRGRRVYLNMVAGGFRHDLLALGDATPHDARYDRLVEYTQIVLRLLEGEQVSHDGLFYTVRNLRLTPSLPPQLMPGVFVSGSSAAGLAAASALGATAVKYPRPPAEEIVNGDATPSGIRVGVIAREDDRTAWEVAHRRFPPDRRGAVTHALAMKVSDSAWHRQLSALGREPPSEVNPYWLGPFENYKTFCPYLVGSYERVADELARYLRLGFRTFILDTPPDEEELVHTAAAFAHAEARSGVAGPSS